MLELGGSGEALLIITAATVDRQTAVKSTLRTTIQPMLLAERMNDSRMCFEHSKLRDRVIYDTVKRALFLSM